MDDLMKSWQKSVKEYQQQQEKWKQEDLASASSTNNHDSRNNNEEIVLSGTNDVDILNQHLSQQILDIQNISNNTQQLRAKDEFKLLLFLQQLYQYKLTLRKENLSFLTREQLEPYYQNLISEFSPAYLELCEWYVGETLINNPQFIFPLENYAFYHFWFRLMGGIHSQVSQAWNNLDWIKSSWLIQVIRTKFKL